MCSLERFKIDLKGLTAEVTTLEYDLDNGFFSALDQTEVESGTRASSTLWTRRKWKSERCMCRCLYARHPAFLSFSSISSALYTLRATAVST